MSQKKETGTPSPENYYTFHQAWSLLDKRLGTTDREMAAWLFFQQIKAFANVHCFARPSRADLSHLALSDWPSADKESPPYINDALAGLFFLREEIENFVPPTRYISYSDLIRRWLPFLGSKAMAVATIRSLISQSRLLDFAPGLGPTELSSNIVPAPPAYWAMFDLKQIEVIEESDFPSCTRKSADTLANPPRPPRRKQRDQESTILETIRKLNHDPLRMPKQKPGKAGIKAEVWQSLARNKSLFSSRSTFDGAWDRLRGDKSIKDAT